MKKNLVALFFSLTVAVTFAASRSESIVYIDGVRYYLHTVAKGETIYSLSKLYDVKDDDLFESNTDLEQEGLKLGSNIKIPMREKIKSISSRKLRRDYESHIVAAGETLYSISKKYSISVESLREANPKLDPAHIAIGDEIYIEKREQGNSSPEQLSREMESYKDNLNSVAPAGYEYHIVKPKQTIYTLIKSCGMSEEEFFDLNKLPDGLKSGSIVLLKTAPAADAQPNIIADELNEISFKSLAPTDTLRISLLLPLSSSGRPLAPFIEFYNGFLLGLEDIKQGGRCVDLMLYNTMRSKSSVYDIVDQERFQASHLIVGPIYEELLAPVVEFAESHSIPVVSPLATLSQISSEVLYQMAPAADNRYDKVGELFSPERNITLIYGQSNDTEFEQAVLPLLDTVSYTHHDYIYEHPGVIQRRKREYDEMLKRMVEAGDSINMVEPLKPSSADLTQFIDNGQQNTIVIIANNETDVDRILAALASAYVGIVSRGGRAPQFEVLSNPAWGRMGNIDRSLYFQDGVVSFSSYHASRDSEAILKFDSRYTEYYGTLASLYAYRGYDAAVIFSEAMYGGIEDELVGKEFTPLQSTYRFESVNGMKINNNWMRVKYKNNYHIKVE